MQNCAFRRGETAFFTIRSVGLPDDQLTGPILGRSAGLQTELGQFGWKSKVRKAQGPFDKKVSGLRLARQDSECAFSATPVSKNSPQASKTHAFLGVPGGGSRASQEASETAPRGQAPQEASKSPPRRPMCVCYCILQVKTGLRSKKPMFFNGFRLPRSFQEASCVSAVARGARRAARCARPFR